MLVHRPRSAEPSYPLKEWDVITKIGDTTVDDQGMIKLNEHLRVRFPYEIQKIATHDKVPRGGKTLTIDLPLLKRRPQLIPEVEEGYPSYFIY